MYVYNELSEYDIAEALQRDEYNGFDYQGARVLAEYLIELAEDTGEPIRFDPVAIRCEYYQDDLESLLDMYSCETLAQLKERTMVLHVSDDMYVIRQF